MRAPVSFRLGVFVLTAVALVVVWGGYADVSRAVLATAGGAMTDVEGAVAELRRTLLIIAVLLTALIVLVAVLLLVLHRSTERLRAALSVKRNFLARISHELRTPLNAILGFSEVIRDQLLGPQAVPRYAEYAKDIHDSGRHLLALINDILDLTRLQAGDMALDPQPLDVATAIEWAIRMTAPQARAKGIQLDINVHPGTPPVTADDRALKQMLLNLLSNAVTFTPEGGRVLVTAGVGAQGGCRIRVVDNGIGMTPEQLSQAVLPFGQAVTELPFGQAVTELPFGQAVTELPFGQAVTELPFGQAAADLPFGQAAAMVARPGQGSGLGLPIVKSLMEAHGGRLHIDSRPGEGSQVTLEFGGRALCRSPAC